MYARIPVFVSLALMGCQSDFEFRDELPVEPSEEPRPVESETALDVIVQTVTPSVDILYMVDNSCSMADDQADLSENFPTFMRWFLGSGLDYHIGVVSSDIRDPSHTGKLQGGFGKRWISTDDNNQIAQFQQMAVLGNGGASPEKGLAGIYFSKTDAQAIRHNDGFFRDSSAIHTICVADEWDYTTEISLGEFTNWYDGLKRAADERTFSAIESPSPGASGGGGQRYGLVTQQIGGVLWNVHDEDWSPALDLLGLRATGRKTEYFLSQLPVEPSIRVTVRTPLGDGTDPDEDFIEELYPRAFWQGDTLVNADGEEIDGAHWYYVEGRNSITFVNFVPDDLARVAIEYTVRSSVVDEVLGGNDEPEEPESEN